MEWPVPSFASTLRSLRMAGENVTMVSRLARDLPGATRQPMSPSQVKQRVSERLAAREQHLLAVVDRLVFGYARSPYGRLMRHAGCEPGDVRRLIADEGVEGSLRVLAERGVYVTFEELKGRQVAVRGSTRFNFHQDDFDNPLVRPHTVRYTGGSGGQPSRVRYSLAYIDELADSGAITIAAHGMHDPANLFRWPVPFHWMIGAARLGQPAEAWFYPVHPLPGRVIAAAHGLSLLGRLGGFRFPTPRRCDLATPEVVVRWLADPSRPQRNRVIWTMPSAGARIGAAATALGVDLRGVALFVGGEPITPARRHQMEASGARVLATYSSTETSGLSHGCATPIASDDVHLMLDRFALVQRRREVSPGGPVVDAGLVTSLSLHAGKVTFNTELGDYARIENRACGCELGELGLRTHLYDIRSFEKVTGEGVTFARSQLERVLESALPARFGGSSLDFQLAEEEHATGATRLILRVSPSVGPLDTANVRTVFLEEIARGGLLERYQASIWSNADTMEVVREVPLTTSAGKVLPFHLLKRTSETLELR
jgi:hypothetical protein